MGFERKNVFHIRNLRVSLVNLTPSLFQLRRLREKAD